MPSVTPKRDLTGEVVGLWTIIGYAEYRNGHHHWHCRCACSAEKTVNQGSLLKGVSRSCGCDRDKALGRRRLKDLSGRRFGRLVALERSGTADGRALWRCRCDCGKSVDALSSNLIRGASQSCGCVAREKASERGKHWMTDTPEWWAWCAMRQRCYNPRNKGYPYYGARGIRVCDRWLESFENFYADMGPRPSPEHSIDRFPNNDGDYKTGNCRWATKSEQAYNRRPKQL